MFRVGLFYHQKSCAAVVRYMKFDSSVGVTMAHLNIELVLCFVSVDSLNRLQSFTGYTLYIQWSVCFFCFSSLFYIYCKYYLISFSSLLSLILHSLCNIYSQAGSTLTSTAHHVLQSQILNTNFRHISTNIGIRSNTQCT